VENKVEIYKKKTLNSVDAHGIICGHAELAMTGVCLKWSLPHEPRLEFSDRVVRLGIIQETGGQNP
jgi:hypothetical protein